MEKPPLPTYILTSFALPMIFHNAETLRGYLQ